MTLELHIWRAVIGVGLPAKQVTGWRWWGERDGDEYRGISYAVWPFYVFLGWRV